MIERAEAGSMEATAMQIMPTPNVEYEPTLYDRFVKFHYANPHVYETLLSLARAEQQAGQKRIGLKHLWERLRGELKIKTKSDDWGLNNSFTSLYARMLVHYHPDLAPMFELRRRRTP
jgi:hypothetical protein